MSLNRSFHFAQWGLLAGVLLLAAGTALTLAVYPAVLTAEPAPAAFFLALLGSALLVYTAVAVFGARAASAATRLGLGCGLACGAAWTVELLAANLIHPADTPLGQGPYRLLYFGSTALAVLLPVLAGFLAARQAGRVRAGLWAGLLCGLCGGLIIYLAWLALAGVFIPAGRLDPQTVQEFQRSRLPDLTTYIVSDYLAGMTVHLWIGLITGLVFGGLGSVLGRTFARPAA